MGGPDPESDDYKRRALDVFQDANRIRFLCPSPSTASFDTTYCATGEPFVNTAVTPLEPWPGGKVK